jgi:UrcA family protein
MRTFHFLALGAALPLLFVAAPTALAQDDSRYADQGPAYNGPTEQVEVYGPKVSRGHFGEVEKVSTSREITMSDAALRTHDGAHELRVRVHLAARDICDDLRGNMPHAASSWSACYDEALVDGMRHADSAIERARYRSE